mgnify:CR=1 FL=1
MNQTNQTFWMTNWTFQMTNWTIWKHLISNSMNWMTNATNDLTTQKTNWTNSLEQLNLKWNNDRMNESLLFYKDGERLCKEKTWSPLWQKRAEKPFSHKQGLSISKTNQAHIVEYFSVLKLTLSFLCWLIQHHHLKIHSIIELVNSLNKMMTLENSLLYQTCWKRMAFEIQPPI